MKFSQNRFLVYPKAESPKALKDFKIGKCTLDGHLYPSYFGWRIYWNIQIIAEGAALITEGPIGYDYPHLGFLSSYSWVKGLAVGSDRGQLIVEIDDVQESGSDLSLHWGLLKKGELDVRCHLPFEPKYHVAIAARCQFGGLSCDLSLVGSALAQIPKNWKVQFRNINGRVVLFPENFDRITKVLTSH